MTLRFGECVVVWLALFILTMTWQYHCGALAADFNNDEASHYVSSLLIGDALADVSHGRSIQPIATLLDFHGHYPLVGIGHWPPLYYGVVAVWMDLASTSRVAVVVLSGIVAAGLGTVIHAVVRGRLGPIAGILTAALFIACPLVAESAGQLMLDLPVALLCLLGMLLYERYLSTGRVLFSALFGVVAAAALMTKGTGACMALLPPLAILIGRRWDLLRRSSFWLPALIAGLVAVPWYLVTYRLVAPGFRFSWGPAYTVAAAGENGRLLLAALGAPAIVAAAVEVVAAFSPRRGADPLATSAASLLLAVFAFQCIVPAALEPRYLAPALPPLLILASLGAWRVMAVLAARFGTAGRMAAMTAVGLAVAVGVQSGIQSMPLAQKGVIAAAARQIWAHNLASDSAILVALNGDLEPAAIAELAMRDPNRPSIFVIRGSRLLGGGGYNNSDYRPRFDDADKVAAAIDGYGIGFVLLRTDEQASEWEHIGQVRQLAARYPERWRPVWRNEAVSPGLVLYQLTGSTVRPVSPAQLLALNAPRALVEQ